LGLTDPIATLFLDSADAIRPIEVSGDARWLSLGTIDYWVTPELLTSRGLSPADEPEPPGEDEHDRSKRLMTHFADAFGYSSYEELDINDRAEIRHDLNYPIPDDLRGRYDLVWDCGSIEHVMNAYQAMRNMLDLARVGGILLCLQAIGDQTNAGYWTISPNFYLDFLGANGVEILEFLLWDRRGHTLRAGKVITKGQPVGATIPPLRVPGYYLRTARADLGSRLLAHRFPARALASLEFRWPSLARVAYTMLGRSPKGGPDWFLFVIGRKTARVPEAIQIQNVYR